jgi:hypothetical protein
VPSTWATQPKLSRRRRVRSGSSGGRPVFAVATQLLKNTVRNDDALHGEILDNGCIVEAMRQELLDPGQQPLLLRVFDDVTPFGA